MGGSAKVQILVHDKKLVLGDISTFLGEIFVCGGLGCPFIFIRFLNGEYFLGTIHGQFLCKAFVRRSWFRLLNWLRVLGWFGNIFNQTV